MRMKEKTKKRIQGSISVLLVIILLPMMTFSAIIVDISRVNMAKQMMSSAGDLTMNTALANYDTILKDVYGLFAMSQAEGMDNEQLGIELNNYFAKTLSSYGVVSEEDADDYVATLIGDFRDILNEGNIDTKNFLELSNIDLTATKVEGSSLANASVMRKQIVEYMKYRAPMGLGLSFLDSLTSFKKMDAQNKVVEAQVKAQESTQDVTKACQTLIKLIRDYDKRVAEINDALTGVSSSSDTAIIPLEDYDTHVSKYLNSWGENYTHINKLSLVFLANTPSVDSVYLKSLAYASGEKYIKADGTLYSGSNTGISVNVNLAGDTASAKTQIETQITNLNNNYKGYANKYTTSMLPSNLLTYNANNISSATISKENEDSAISSFIKFEKFLLDQSDSGNVTYSQVRSVLEQIAILDKYRSNYETKINSDISAAEAEKQAAQNALNFLVSTRDGAAGTMNDRISYINNRINTFVNGYEDLDDAVDFLGTNNKQSEIKAALAQLPTRSVGYSQYYNSYIKSGESDIYLEYFKWLVNNSSFGTSGTAAQKKIITEAKNHVNANGWDANGFDNYMTSKLSAAEEGEDLYKLLSCLKTCHAYAITYKNNISTYNNAADQIPGAQSTLNEKTQKVTSLNNEKTRTINSVKTCLQGYHSFGTAYQADAYYYNHYINAAKNTVGPEAQKIQTHFTQLLSYLNELRTDLNAISDQITVVKGAIETYNANLDTWESSNTTYTSNNGGDSFSSQTSDDIEKARTEYDADLYDTLDTFVIAMWNEFDDLYTKLTESTNFTYGSMRIDQIASADNIISAISGTSFSDVVTVDEATQKLSSLYKGETIDYNPYTMDYSNPKQLAFLSPQILQIQALKYLNSTYPDDTTLSDAQKQENTNTKAEYDKTKDKLTGKNTSIETDGSNADGDNDVEEKVTTDFGYTYSSNSMGSNLPSGLTQTEKKTFDEKEYQISTSGEGDDERLNATSSLSGQTGTTSSVLSGLGNIATTAVENLYILNYVFENFSYNTIVQDQINKDIPLTKSSLLLQMTEANTNFSKPENITNAKNKTTTLSNFAINEKNNYLYGGEIEYILFGNSNPAKNVTSAKASIYAIRFGFNCIFAFTDSEIRNSTMAAGLAVQAATLGIVPYQVVQIVLQLALAAAESAIDLSAMNHGLSVVIVKTKDTWSLSMSGASNALKDAGNAAAQMLTDKITDGVTKAISSVTSGLNDLLDAGAEELGSAITNVANSLEDSAKGVLEGVADEILTAVMNEIESGLNGLQYINNGADGGLDNAVTKEQVRSQAETVFQNVRGKLDAIVTQACGGNEMASGLASTFKRYAEQMIGDVETEVLSTIDNAENVDITAYIASELNNLKLMLIEKGNQFISDLAGPLETKAQSAVQSTKETLQGYVTQCGEELTEEAADLIKNEISSLTDSFVDTTLKVNGTNSATDVKSSPVSMFKFGYKDYLMLLTYISICCGDSVLVRTSDVIQMNLQNAGEGADYQHKANTGEGSFLMSKAYTYISISASADLDMFFMDFSIFADQVADDTSNAEDPQTDEETNGTKITYKGLLGY